MKNLKYLWPLPVIIIIALLVLIDKSQVQAPNKPNLVTNATVSTIHPTASNSVTQQPLAVVVATNGNRSEILNEYRNGTISKGQAMLDILRSQNNQPQDFYGKVVDQYGQPILGVYVTGNLMVRGGLGDGANNQTYKTQTDADGLFQFIDIKGWQLGVTVNKDGYLMAGHGEGFEEPASGKTTPDSRAILTMWKQRGAEPLTNFMIDSKIPYDGTPITFDLEAQKINPGGDFRVTLLRSPLMVRRGGEVFDWSLKIEMLQGGLEAENDPYPYWAPEDRYNSSFTIDVSSNDVPWYSHLAQDFYIRNTAGQYGLMHANVYTALTPARVQFNFTFNPSGSQNLEPPAP
jgi:hypothetical protein